MNYMYSLVMAGTGSCTETPVHRYPTALEKLTTSAPPNIKTVYEAFRYRLQQEPDKRTLGRRRVLRVVKDPSGWRRATLGDYEWLTYREIDIETRDLGAGLAQLGSTRIAIFAPTSREWTLCMLACYSQALEVVTAYDTLGARGLLHAVSEAGARVLIAKADQLCVVNDVWDMCGADVLVYYADAYGMPGPAQTALERLQARTRVLHLDEVAELGRQHPRDVRTAQADDTALIMYTSGTTGPPKGAVVAHGGLLAICGAIHELVPDTIDYSQDIVLSYLPLSHVLAFFVETYCLYSGIAIGYGSPRTLTEDGVVGCDGDIRALRPAVMLGVPQVWNAMRAGILRQVAQRPLFVQRLFHGAVWLKQQLVGLGLSSWLLDKVVFKKTRAGTGGRLKIAIAGGAPLNAHVQRFIAATVCPVIQGYGLTEASGLVSVQIPGDCSVCNVGAPMPNVELKLVDAAAEGYFARNGQGEIWVRGPSVFKGYLHNDALTRETVTEDGWLMTGDIGEWAPLGRLRVIDRRKNLVKLASGEYIALEALEAAYGTSQYVANVCVIASAFMQRPCALINADAAELASWARKQGVPDSDAASCTAFRELVASDLARAARRNGLQRQELLAAIRIDAVLWTPENGLLTAANKLRRRDICRVNQPSIDEMLCEAN
ncbi:long-chain fatty acid-CoA ligase [Coemansia erecta]|nr:long-chain fatty acid-CoA ligase [Coemansia sp. RSA 2618]KAJ2830070.1 long-chain fatty acid-CoA ligase [Coemansia erecta]